MDNDTIRGNSPYADLQYANLTRASRLAAILFAAERAGRKVRSGVAEALALELQYLADNFDLVPKK